MLLEVILKLDPSKKQWARSSPNLLNYLGSLGGFKKAMDALFSGFATYFSANFLWASIASKFYFTKASKGGGNSKKNKYKIK
jgi:hypothetical protein